MAQRPWPPWWGWELELSVHLLKRMKYRGFTEVELRGMLEDATGVHRDVEPGRWRVETELRRRPWEVIVEPDRTSRVVVVVTAFQVD